MEMWDIYSSDGSKTGEIIERKKGALKKGQFHLVVHIWFIDDKKRVLIQQRSMEVEFLKGKWAITGGCAVAGENEIDAAIRESYEEVGIRIDKDDLTLIKKYRGKNDFVYVFAVKRKIGICDVTMQTEEVQAVKWASVEELKSMVEKKLFHSYIYLPELYEYIESI